MAFGLGKNSINSLETQFTKAQAELSAAETAFSNAVQAIEAPPIELTDEQVGDLVSNKNLTEVRLVQARAAVRRAEHSLTEARNLAAEKERKAEIDKVTAAGAAAQKLVVEELSAATRGLRRAIRAMAEADCERLKLNTRLPAELQISSFEEALFVTPGQPEREISRDRELLWINPFGGEPYAPEFLKNIHDNGDDTATLRHLSSGSLRVADSSIISGRRYFDRVRVQVGVRPYGEYPLAGLLNLPGLAGQPAGWRAMPSASPEQVIAELDRLKDAALTRPQSREVVERLEVKSPIFKSKDARLAWEEQQVDAERLDAI
jgi:hypothetical protein